jgi:hypothetical protein
MRMRSRPSESVPRSWIIDVGGDLCSSEVQCLSLQAGVVSLACIIANTEEEGHKDSRGVDDG